MLKIFSASFLQEFDSMTAGQKVKTVWFFSGLTHGAIPYNNDEVSRTLDLFIQTERALEELKTTAETLPIPEKVDFSKYDWSGEHMFSAQMSPKAIKDPELRKVWQSALDRDYVIRLKSGMKADAIRFGQLFSTISQSFIERLDVSSDESKAAVKKKLDAPELKKLKGGVIASLLETELKGIQQGQG